MMNEQTFAAGIKSVLNKAFFDFLILMPRLSNLNKLYFFGRKRNFYKFFNS